MQGARAGVTKIFERKETFFAPSKTIRIDKTEGLFGNDIYHRDCIQVVDDRWVHLINGSNYARLKGKEELMERVLRKINKDSKEK